MKKIDKIILKTYEKKYVSRKQICQQEKKNENEYMMKQLVTSNQMDINI